MNHFDVGARRTCGGWHGTFRRVHKAEEEIVRCNGRPVIYLTHIEAKEAAMDALLCYLNTDMRRDGEIVSNAVRAQAEAVFSKRASEG